MPALSELPVRAAVIGDPISHSLSPVLHNYWLKEHAIPARYDAIHVTSDNLEQLLKTLADGGLKGINITLPHKERAAELIVHRDEFATKIGAVNTVILSEDGTLHGKNTDAYGFIQNIKAAAPLWNAHGTHALILGAGGAAKAVIAGLITEGVSRITLTNRTAEKAVSLASLLNNVFSTTLIHTVEWGNRHDACADCNLLVNTTQLGMSGQPELEMQLHALPDNAIVTDIVYTPLKTQLLQNAELRGLQVVDGLGMLLWQAQPAFEGWFGIKPEVTDALRDHVVSALTARG